jgi:hypothetical protein
MEPIWGYVLCMKYHVSADHIISMLTFSAMCLFRNHAHSLSLNYLPKFVTFDVLFFEVLTPYLNYITIDFLLNFKLLLM